MITRPEGWPELTARNKLFVIGIQTELDGQISVVRDLPPDRYGRASMVELSIGDCEDGFRRGFVQRFIKRPPLFDKQQTNATGRVAESTGTITCLKRATFGVDLSGRKPDELETAEPARTVLPDYFARRAVAAQLHHIGILLTAAGVITAPERPVDITDVTMATQPVI